MLKAGQGDPQSRGGWGGDKESDQLIKVVNQISRVGSLLNSGGSFVRSEVEVHALSRRRFLGESLALQRAFVCGLASPGSLVCLKEHA